jgi:transcriptional regulator GlxA family with amidase domain
MSRRMTPLPLHITHIHAHVDERIRLDALSEIAGVSAFHLQREFTRITGHSPARRVQLLRLKRASRVPAGPVDH